MATLLKFAFGFAAVYVLLTLGLYFGQRILMYHPDKARVAPRAAGLPGVTERVLETPDGEKLIAWQAKARPGQPTLLYFHGNAGNLASRAERIAMFAARGWGVFMLSYRGFGGSSGGPSETANIADAELALQTLRNEGAALKDIILYGESLGTGIVTQLAARHGVAGLILDAPFTSMTDMAAEHYPWLWVRPFVRDRYESAAVLPGIKAPILILHGALDPITPVAMSRKLAELAGPRAKLMIFPDGHHADLFAHGAMAAIAEFIAGLERAEKKPAPR